MNGTLPTWLTWLLDLPQAESGEGIAAHLENTWSWAPWVTLLFVAICCIGILAAYLTEKGTIRRGLRLLLATIRMALVGLVLFMLAEWMLAQDRTGLPYLVLVLDDSASMSKVDRYADEKLQAQLLARLKSAGYSELSRENIAKALVAADDGKLLAEIERRFNLKLYFLSDAARAQTGDRKTLIQAVKELEAKGEHTRLGAGVRKILDDLRGTPPAAIVLFTDGINTDGETLTEAASYAKRKGVPLFTVGLGSEQPIRDLELSDLLVDEVAFVNDIETFDVKLTASGYEGRQVEVVVKDKSSGDVLARKSVAAGRDGQSQRVRLQHRPLVAGDIEYIVEVAPLPDEANPDNNRVQRQVSVRKEQVKVLFVQAYPSYEFRFLKQLLQRDTNSIELKTVLQDSDVEYADTDKTALRVFPVRREDLFAYDVVILGDVNPALLSGAVKQNLADFVREKGGGLIVSAGPKYTPVAFRDTPLAPLLPIELDDVKQIPTEIKGSFAVVPTELGLASPEMQLGDTPAETAQIWSKLPELYGLCQTPHIKPGALVLAECDYKGQKLPVISLQYSGAGKVIFHATDDTWRWRHLVGDVYLARYWIQTIRYLSRSKLLGKDRSAELTLDRREYQRGEPVRLRLRFLDERLAPPQDDGVSLLIEQPGLKKHQVTLRRDATNRGVFEGVFLPSSEGAYHASLVTPALPGVAPAADFLVLVPAGESERLQMDVTELRKAAEETNGRYYTVANAERLAQELPEGRQVKIESKPSVPIWNRWRVLLVFLGLIVTEWILRKNQGLL